MFNPFPRIIPVITLARFPKRIGLFTFRARSNTSAAQDPVRLHYLDWLRVLVVGSLLSRAQHTGDRNQARDQDADVAGLSLSRFR